LEEQEVQHTTEFDDIETLEDVEITGGSEGEEGEEMNDNILQVSDICNALAEGTSNMIDEQYREEYKSMYKSVTTTVLELINFEELLETSGSMKKLPKPAKIIIALIGLVGTVIYGMKKFNTQKEGEKVG